MRTHTSLSRWLPTLFLALGLLAGRFSTRPPDPALAAYTQRIGELRLSVDALRLTLMRSNTSAPLEVHLADELTRVGLLLSQLPSPPAELSGVTPFRIAAEKTVESLEASPSPLSELRRLAGDTPPDLDAIRARVLEIERLLQPEGLQHQLDDVQRQLLSAQREQLQQSRTAATVGALFLMLSLFATLWQQLRGSSEAQPAGVPQASGVSRPDALVPVASPTTLPANSPPPQGLPSSSGASLETALLSDAHMARVKITSDPSLLRAGFDHAPVDLETEVQTGQEQVEEARRATLQSVQPPPDPFDSARLPFSLAAQKADTVLDPEGPPGLSSLELDLLTPSPRSHVSGKVRLDTPSMPRSRSLTGEEASIPIDHVDDPLLVLTHTGLIRSINASARRFFGVGEEEVVGQPAVERLFPPALQSQLQQSLQAVRSAPSEQRERVRLTLGDVQTEKPIQLEVSYHESAESPGLLMVVRDAENQRRMEELQAHLRRNTEQLERSTIELRIAEARQDAILKAALDCIIGLDADGNLIEVNPATEKTFRLPRKALLGVSISRLLLPPHSPLEPNGGGHPDGELSNGSSHDSERGAPLESSAPLLLSAVRAPIEEKCPESLRHFGLNRRQEVMARRGDGTLFPAELTLVRLKLPGQPLFTAYLRDITEAKKVEQMKNEFISIVSHELRTPLTSIRGSLGLLQGGAVGALPAPVVELITIARNNSERLIRLVNEMLDLEKIEAGRVTLKLEPLDGEKLIEAACLGVRGMAETSSVQLRQDIQENVTLRGDRDRLIQVLTNLLSNAIKYTPPGMVVTTRLERLSADWLRFSVIDSGPGIAPEQLERLFTRFHQVDPSDSRARQGSGLGLSISKALVELHSGKIGVQSEPGHGSTFYFELPTPPSQV